MMAAITALMISPGRKITTLVNLAQMEVFVINAMIGAPIRLINITPKIKFTTISFQVLTSIESCSIYKFFDFHEKTLHRRIECID